MMAKQRANDLAELNVDIELFPMPKPDCDQNINEQNGELEPYQFDILKFYASIISYDEDDQ